MRELLTLTLLLLPALLFAAPKTEREDVSVVRWIDGDTLEVHPGKGKDFIVRIWGIDAPELGQPWGKESKRFAELEIPPGREIVLTKRGRDRYGRTLADVGMIISGRIGDKWSVNFAPRHVRDGNAWAYRPFKHQRDTSSQLVACEEKARMRRTGLWYTSKEPIPPWEWRKKKGKNDCQMF